MSIYLVGQSLQFPQDNRDNRPTLATPCLHPIPFKDKYQTCTNTNTQKSTWKSHRFEREVKLQTDWQDRIKACCLKQESKAISWIKTTLCGSLIVWVIVWMHFCRQGWWVGVLVVGSHVDPLVGKFGANQGEEDTSTLLLCSTPQAAGPHKWPRAPECH